MRFPKRIKYRGKTLAVIYDRCKGRDSYRVAWHVAGRRRMASFPSYSLAKGQADALVRDLANGSQVTALQPAQARDVLAALERLQALYQSTGRRVSLLAATSEYAEAASQLNGLALNEAVKGYLRSVASVRRKDVAEAVEEFLQTEAPRAKASAGQRAQISPEYAYILGIRLQRFAATFPNTAVCDLNKEHLDAFIGALVTLKGKSRNRRAVDSPKTRNHYRAAIGQFLRWCVRKDYLSPTHRLLEADGLRLEHANTGEIAFYTPRELAVLLASADQTLRPVISHRPYMTYAPMSFCGTLNSQLFSVAAPLSNGILPRDTPA